MWATLTDVAEAAKDSAHGGVGVAKAAATEILRLCCIGRREIFWPHKGPRKPLVLDLIIFRRAFSSFHFQADLGYFFFCITKLTTVLGHLVNRPSTAIFH